MNNMELPPWQKTKTHVLGVIPENIPQQLKDQRRWLIWKAEKKPNGKINKPPFRTAQPNIKASKDNPDDWATFEAAYQVYQMRDDVAGIGFVVNGEDDLVFIDLDGCVENGEISDEAQSVINACGTYAEISPSGRGIRIIGRGRLPGSQFNNVELGREMYDGTASAYLTLTGHLLDGYSSIEDCQEAIVHFYGLWKTNSEPGNAEPDVDASSVAESVDLSRLTDRTIDLINGIGWDTFPSRNEIAYGVAKDMARDGYSDAEILSLLSNPEYRIAEVALSRRGGDIESAREWLAKYPIKRARGDVNTEQSVIIKFPAFQDKPASHSASKPQNKPSQQIPGALGQFVTWYAKTAITQQPELAIQAALAFGSVVCGRQYVTTRRANFSNLWFLNVAKSGAGKEHANWCIDRLLHLSDAGDLLCNGYTSKGAVFSMLAKQPRHIAVIDELGRYLEAAMQDKGHVHFKDGITAMMESWNRSDSTMRPPQHSERGLSREQKDELNQVVHKPSITILAMTTPSTLFNAITRESVRDGFLSRFLLCESQIEGADTLSEASTISPPQSLIDWAKAALAHRGDLPMLQVSGIEPVTHKVPIDDGAWLVFNQTKQEEGRLRRWAEESDLAELANRTTQKAMRIALILAVSVDPVSPKITRELAQWASEYALHLDRKMVELAAQHVTDGRLGKLISNVRAYIIKAAEKGRTKRELSRPYSAHGSDFDRVLRALEAQGDIALVDLTNERQRGGRRRIAYVWRDFLPDEALSDE